MIMIFPLQAAAAEGQEVGVFQIKRSESPTTLFCICRMRCCSKLAHRHCEPSKTAHSWQQIIFGMKWKVEPFTVLPPTPLSARPGPAPGEKTSPPPYFSLCSTNTARLDTALYASPFEIRSKENTRTNKSVSGVNLCSKQPHLLRPTASVTRCTGCCVFSKVSRMSPSLTRRP